MCRTKGIITFINSYKLLLLVVEKLTVFFVFLVRYNCNNCHPEMLLDIIVCDCK